MTALHYEVYPSWRGINYYLWLYPYTFVPFFFNVVLSGPPIQMPRSKSRTVRTAARRRRPTASRPRKQRGGSRTVLPISYFGGNDSAAYTGKCGRSPIQTAYGGSVSTSFGEQGTSLGAQFAGPDLAPGSGVEGVSASGLQTGGARRRRKSVRRAHRRQPTRRSRARRRRSRRTRTQRGGGGQYGRTVMPIKYYGGDDTKAYGAQCGRTSFNTSYGRSVPTSFGGSAPELGGGYRGPSLAPGGMGEAFAVTGIQTGGATIQSPSFDGTTGLPLSPQARLQQIGTIYFVQIVPTLALARRVPAAIQIVNHNTVQLYREQTRYPMAIIGVNDKTATISIRRNVTPIRYADPAALSEQRGTKFKLYDLISTELARLKKFIDNGAIPTTTLAVTHKRDQTFRFDGRKQGKGVLGSGWKDRQFEYNPNQKTIKYGTQDGVSDPFKVRGTINVENVSLEDMNTTSANKVVHVKDSGGRVYILELEKAIALELKSKSTSTEPFHETVEGVIRIHRTQAGQTDAPTGASASTAEPTDAPTDASASTAEPTDAPTYQTQFPVQYYEYDRIFKEYRFTPSSSSNQVIVTGQREDGTPQNTVVVE